MNFDPLTITHLHPVWLASLRGMVVLLVCHLLYILCLKRGSVALRNVFWRWTIGASIAVAILSFLPALVHIEVPAETPVHREIAPVEIEAGSTEPSQPVATPTQSWHPNYNQLALGLWAVVAAILMLRWPLAHLLLIRLKKGARTINDARWLQTLNDVHPPPWTIQKSRSLREHKPWSPARIWTPEVHGNDPDDAPGSECQAKESHPSP
jgi:hypothetical protein